ncbi:MAG: hypothetical protein MK110_17630 [Fuerstiella sp.]|nr:hypothetical protein [Fuerstiella sp.]
MRPQNRKTFLSRSPGGVLAASLVFLHCLTAQSAEQRSQQRRPAPPQYQVIYNWDGAPHGYSDFPQSLEQFLDKTFAPLKETQVEALFFCVGEHEATWNSESLPTVGDNQHRVYSSANAMRHNENIRAMIERGENPYAAMVRRGHELGIDVYVSIRMNDNHFRGLQLDELSNADLDGLTQLRRDHPEWCLGADQAPPWFAASWNMAIPEVREHRFEYIQEALALADWDGVELDWQRHAFHLPADDAWRLRYVLTDLQRAVRQHTSRIADKRNKPFPVAVRVATTLESCRHIGYDLETWIREDLCDIITAGGGAGSDPGVEVENFLNLVQGTPVRFYGGFDGGFWGTHDGLKPRDEWQRDWFRGTSQGYWARGAHGMYVFNWHANERTRRDLLTQIGSQQTLRGTNKVFSAVHRLIRDTGDWARADLHDRINGETPVALYPTLTADGPVFRIGIFDNVSQGSSAQRLQQIDLRIKLDHFVSSDRVQVKLDGLTLGQPDIRNAKAEDPLNPSDVDESSWLVWPLDPAAAEPGIHQVQVRLQKRDPRIRPPLVVQHVEFHVKYDSGKEEL